MLSLIFYLSFNFLWVFLSSTFLESHFCSQQNLSRKLIQEFPATCLPVGTILMSNFRALRFCPSLNFTTVRFRYALLLQIVSFRLNWNRKHLFKVNFETVLLYISPWNNFSLEIKFFRKIFSKPRRNFNFSRKLLNKELLSSNFKAQWNIIHNFSTVSKIFENFWTFYFIVKRTRRIKRNCKMISCKIFLKGN